MTNRTDYNVGDIVRHIEVNCLFIIIEPDENKFILEVYESSYPFIKGDKHSDYVFKSNPNWILVKATKRKLKGFGKFANENLP